MVFQHYALFPHLTVGENVAFGLEGRARAAGARFARAWPRRCARGTLGIRAAPRRPRSRAASSSAWRWRARSRPAARAAPRRAAVEPRPDAARADAPRARARSGGSASRRSSSPTSRRRRSISATAWRSCTTAGSSRSARRRSSSSSRRRASSRPSSGARASCRAVWEGGRGARIAGGPAWPADRRPRTVSGDAAVGSRRASRGADLRGAPRRGDARGRRDGTALRRPGRLLPGRRRIRPARSRCSRRRRVAGRRPGPRRAVVRADPCPGPSGGRRERPAPRPRSSSVLRCSSGSSAIRCVLTLAEALGGSALDAGALRRVRAAARRVAGALGKPLDLGRDGGARRRDRRPARLPLRARRVSRAARALDVWSRCRSRCRRSSA